MADGRGCRNSWRIAASRSSGPVMRAPSFQPPARRRTHREMRRARASTATQPPWACTASGRQCRRRSTPPGTSIRARGCTAAADDRARAARCGRCLLAPADGAEPGEEGRLAAPRPEVAHGGDERGLDDVFGYVRVPQAQDREAEQPGEIVREELVERTFIAAEHAPDQFALAAVVHLDQLEGATILILR